MYLEVMAAITGLILDSVRPARIRSDGEAAARESAVSAPIPPRPGPVITTGFLKQRAWYGSGRYVLVFPFTLSWKASTTSLPVEENSQRVILDVDGDELAGKKLSVVM